MALTRFPLTVHYEDGDVQQVIADQRDYVVLERAFKMSVQKALEDMTITAVRHMAYTALMRINGGHQPRDLTRDEWEATVIEVQAKTDEVETVDPTQPGAQSDALSESRTGQGGRRAKS